MFLSCTPKVAQNVKSKLKLYKSAACTFFYTTAAVLDYNIM